MTGKHDELVARLEAVFGELRADVYRHGYMGPYRKGIVAGLALAHRRVRIPDAPQLPSSYDNPRTVATWEAGLAVGYARGNEAIDEILIALRATGASQ